MSFDVEAATAAYIDGLGEEALAQAAAYTTGNQWLMLWGLLISAIVTPVSYTHLTLPTICSV